MQKEETVTNLCSNKYDACSESDLPFCLLLTSGDEVELLVIGGLGSSISISSVPKYTIVGGFAFDNSNI